MKYLKTINLITVFLPVVLFIIGEIFERGAGIALAILSMLFVGAIQILLGLMTAFMFPKNKNIKIYLLGVAIFFMLLYVLTNMNNDTLVFIILPMPILLCCYLTHIIHKLK